MQKLHRVCFRSQAVGNASLFYFLKGSKKDRWKTKDRRNVITPGGYMEFLVHESKSNRKKTNTKPNQTKRIWTSFIGKHTFTNAQGKIFDTNKVKNRV